MKVSLGFHYRPDSPRECLRGYIFDKIKPVVSNLYNFENIYVEDSGHHPYNRAASRNKIVQRALEDQADVIVICDADSIPEQQPLIDAINGCFRDGRLHVPFVSVNVLSVSILRRKPIGLQRARPILTYGPSCGGVYVIRPGRWVHIGGMDERIVGWGYEDQILHVTSRTFTNSYEHHAGSLHTFSHGTGSDHFHTDENKKLRDLYNSNIGNKAKIREIQRNSNIWTTE